LPENPNPDAPCVPARKGRYSIGGGFVVERFDREDDLPDVFDKPTSWEMKGDFARSGLGDTAMTAKVFLVQSGYVAFDYKVVAYDLIDKADVGFRFTIDGVLHNVERFDTEYRYKQFYIALTSGEHVLSWRFVNGAPPTDISRGNYAELEHIRILGTSYAARHDIPCVAGAYQDKEGQTSCYWCPENTFSHGGAESCTPCDSITYSFMGSSECTVRPMCQSTDYAVRYTNCTPALERTKYFVQLEPEICDAFKYPFNGINNTKETCPSCPVGYIRKSGSGICEPCPLGTYYKDQMCVPVPAGHWARSTRTYLPTTPSILIKPAENTQGRVKSDESEENGRLIRTNGNSRRHHFPTESFETYCTGACGNDGWRWLNDTLDSGFHSTSEVDSVLTLYTRLVSKGKLRFRYALMKNDMDPVTDTKMDGLQFFIRHRLQNDPSIIYHPPLGEWQNVMIDLRKLDPDTAYDFDAVMDEPSSPWDADYPLTWVFHQPYGTNGHRRVVLSDIVVEGDETGTSLVTAPCPRGTYSPLGSHGCHLCPVGTESQRTGAAHCTPCPPNTFAESKGTAECEPCGTGTNSTPDRTACDMSSCIFKDGNDVWDLSSLPRHHTLTSGDSNFVISLCQKVGRESMCFDDRNKLLNTFVCEIDLNDGVAQSTGKLANVYFDFLIDQDHRQLKLHYNKGETCGDGKSMKFTDVRFICDTEVTNPNDGLTLKTRTACGTMFEWRNLAACQLCQDEDYVEHQGPCINQEQTVSLVRISNCSGPDVKDLQRQSCRRSYPVTLPIALICIGLFIFLVFALVIIAIRNRKLHEKYEMLVNESTTQRASGGSWSEKDDEKL
jgi:hypothetical protein